MIMYSVTGTQVCSVIMFCVYEDRTVCYVTGTFSINLRNRR